MMKKISHNQSVGIYYSKYYLNEHKDYFTPKRTTDEVQFLIDHLNRTPQSVCDLACGSGRHLIRFKELGIKKGFGLDPNETLLNQASEGLKNDSNFKLVNSDFASFKPDQKYDLVYTLFSSICYCLENTEAQDLINKMVDATSDDGLMVIDTDNIFRLINFLDTQYISSEYESSVFDAETMTLKYKQKTADGILESTPRYYIATELKHFLASAGINAKKIKFYGDFDNSKYSIFSNRLIITAKK